MHLGNERLDKPHRETMVKSTVDSGKIHAILARMSEPQRVLLRDLRSHAGISTGRGAAGAAGGGGTKARREQLKEAARCRPLP